MSKIKGAIVVDTGRCKGCSLCVEACPQHVIALAEKKVNVHGYRYVEAAVPEHALVAPRAPSSVRTAASLFIVRRRTKQWQIRKLH